MNGRVGLLHKLEQPHYSLLWSIAMEKQEHMNTEMAQNPICYHFLNEYAVNSNNLYKAQPLRIFFLPNAIFISPAKIHIKTVALDLKS